MALPTTRSRKNRLAGGDVRGVEAGDLEEVAIETLPPQLARMAKPEETAAQSLGAVARSSKKCRPSTWRKKAGLKRARMDARVAVVDVHGEDAVAVAPNNPKTSGTAPRRRPPVRRRAKMPMLKK